MNNVDESDPRQCENEQDDEDDHTDENPRSGGGQLRRGRTVVGGPRRRSPVSSRCWHGRPRRRCISGYRIRIRTTGSPPTRSGPTAAGGDSVGVRRRVEVDRGRLACRRGGLGTVGRLRRRCRVGLQLGWVPSPVRSLPPSIRDRFGGTIGAQLSVVPNSERSSRGSAPAELTPIRTYPIRPTRPEPAPATSAVAPHALRRCGL
jgi:hypothetical protein